MAKRPTRNRNELRPRKKPAERARRVRTQRKRLVNLGVPEDEVIHMTAPEVRDALKHPERVKREIASRNQ
jgi:hypothetical protein